MGDLDVLNLQISEISSLPHFIDRLQPTTTSGSGRNYLSQEQRKLVESRFRKGVELSDFIPTFMACERVYIDEKDEEKFQEEGIKPSKKRYYNGSALSRRRAEWHGDNTTKTETNKKDRNNLLYLEDGSNDKNSFVPWRAVFTDRSLRPEYFSEWKSTIVPTLAPFLLGSAGVGAKMDGKDNDHKNGSTVTGCSEGNNDERNSYYATFVLEYAPTGALLEARFRVIFDGKEDDEEEFVSADCKGQRQHHCPGKERRIVSNEYRILDNELEIREWWKVHERFSSHEQFFPRGLRFGKKLPPALYEDGWETKMQRVYGSS